MAINKDQECFVRSVEERHPDIVLQDGLSLYLGRGPQTKIKAECMFSSLDIHINANLPLGPLVSALYVTH